jgi:hypothetical protein
MGCFASFGKENFEGDEGKGEWMSKREEESQACKTTIQKKQPHVTSFSVF